MLTSRLMSGGTLNSCRWHASQAGMLVGPAGIGLLREAPLERLMTLERGALGVIALAAGAELRVAELHRTRRQARCVAVGFMSEIGHTFSAEVRILPQ